MGDSGTIFALSNVWTTSESQSKLTSPTSEGLTSIFCYVANFATACQAGSTHHLLSSSGTTFTLQAALDPTPSGITCAGNFTLNAYQCVGVGSVGTIIANTVGSTGTGQLTPLGGSSEVGEQATFSLTWTVPAGKSWRDLHSVDLRLAGDAGIGLWARFLGGGQNALALLDSSGNVIAQGLPGTVGVLDSPTATLDLSQSSFQGSGPTGPSVTVRFAVSFKSPAAGNQQTPAAARVYNTEIAAANTSGISQAFEEVGRWAVRASNPQ